MSPDRRRRPPLPGPRWWARKLIAEGPGYLPRRISYLVRKRWVDRRFPTPAMRRRASLRPGAEPGAEGAGRGAAGPRWHFDADEAARIAERVPAERRERTLRRAEAWLAGRFEFRGHPPILLDPVEWSYAPTSDRTWTWDLNRHTWLAELGVAHRYTGDARFALAFAELSASWIEHNAGRLGRLGWDTPFEVAARLNSWAWCWFFFRSAPEWEPDARRRFLEALGLLAEYLYQTIEVHIPGNHILLEAKALALCAEAFPHFQGSRRWAARAWRILDRELSVQICGDGVHAQRSTMYHRTIAGELAELWLFGERNRRAWSERLGRIVHGMAEFERWIDQGGGNHPSFGDGYAEDTYLRFSAPEVVAGVEGRLPDPERLGDSELTYWLLADCFSRAGPPAPSEERPGARAFPEGGYFVARSGWARRADVLVWDCGPVGHGTNRKHAHLDVLSVTLSVGGVPFLIDPARSRDPARHSRLRGTRSHSTVMVDGEEQAIMGARKHIWYPPWPRLHLWAASAELVAMSGSHDGYDRPPAPVIHGRTILCLPGRCWLLLDRMEGRGHHRIEQVFHLAPGTTLEEGEDGVVAVRGGARLALAPVSGTGPAAFEVEPAVAELRCNRPEQTHLLVRRYEGRVPTTLGVLLVADGRPLTARCLSEAREGVDAIEVTGPGSRLRAYVARARRRPVRPGGDGRRNVAVVVEEYDADGVLRRVLSCDAPPGAPLAGRVTRFVPRDGSEAPRP